MSQPLRVLQLADFYPPNAGGLEFVVQTTAHHLQQRGVEVEVACLGSSASVGQTVVSGVPVTRISGWQRVLGPVYENPERPFHPTFPDPGVKRQLDELIDRFRPGIIHAHSWIVHSALHRAPTIPVLLSLHDYGAFCAKKTNVRNEKTCSQPSWQNCLPCSTKKYGALKGVPLAAGAVGSLSRMDRITKFMPVSHGVALEASKAMQLDGDRVVVLPSMLPELPDDHDEHESVDWPERFILFVGSMSRHKGADVLLDAYRQLADPPPMFMLVLPGDYSPPPTPGVTVIERAPRSLVLEAWQRATIGVVPSTWGEPAPLVVLEAMTSGTALVASSVGGIPEQTLDGECARLVPPSDAKALSLAIGDLLSDDIGRAELAARALERAENYQPKRIVDRLMAIYDDVLGRT